MSPLCIAYNIIKDQFLSYPAYMVWEVKVQARAVSSSSHASCHWCYASNNNKQKASKLGFVLIEMGNELHQQTLDNCDAKRQAALQIQEQEIWALANDMKREALEEAARNAAAEQDRVVKKLSRSYEKTIKVNIYYCRK